MSPSDCFIIVYYNSISHSESLLFPMIFDFVLV
jgi:hypothetical protein